MKPPVCAVCNTAHWASTPHVFSAQTAAAAALVAPKMTKPNPKIVMDPKPPRPNGADPQAAKIKKLEAEVIALRARIEELATENAKFKADAEATEKRRQAQRDRMRTARGGLRRAPKEATP